ESDGIKCWIAPRDLKPGSDWTEGIIQGINSCRLFVLVFSASANSSEHVRREVATAFSLGLAVIPFRTENINPSGSLGYFLGTVHWLDAITPPLQKHLTDLTERATYLLSDQGRFANSISESVRRPKTEPVLPGRFRRPRWIIGILLGSVVILITFWLLRQRQRNAPSEIPPRSIAVLPFDNISANQDDTYFADGVQDEILNNLAKIAQLKVISRTSVMQYRADEKRDLRQIASALGVANVLEGTVRRNGNHVRVSIELVEARDDNTTWADSFDRDLNDIFAIQSEVAQTVATKLAATLSPEEKRNIESKPTENLEAYDLYLRAKELLVSARAFSAYGSSEQPLVDAIGSLEQAIRLDPKFTLAYCASAEAHDLLYFLFDPTPEQRALGDAAMNSALGLQPDLPKVHLAYAYHLYRGYQDYERARTQLAIARRGLPNDSEAIGLEALMDRRQGQFEKAIQEFNGAIARDQRNSGFIEHLALTLSVMRQFHAAAQMFDRLIELRPDQPILRVQKSVFVTFNKTGDDTAVRSAIAALPESMADDRGALNLRLNFAMIDRDWPQAKELIEK